MEAVNTWLGGMNQDMSKLLAKSDTYLYATNLRPVSELGETDGTLEQIRGNNYELSIPDVWNVYKLKVDIASTSINPTTITVFGNTTSVFNVSATTLGSDLNVQLQSLPGYNSNFFVAYDETSVTIWSTTYNSTIDPNVSFTGSGLLYINNGSTPDIYVPAQTNLQPIGSTFIRDKYYLFTCNNNLLNPGGHDPLLPVDPTQVGQIWEMVYDYAEPSGTNNTTIKLVYTNYLDFTAAHPIPPTGTEGRYENDAIQRIYWTDNFNRLRSINVVDPNVMALPVALTNTIPNVDFSIPILQTVNSGGNLNAGVYQAAYRLTNIGGAKTNYSVPSNIVQIAGAGYPDTTALDALQFANYLGNSFGATTSKSITWQIYGLDTNYDNIEIIILKRDIYTDLPTIFTILTDVVPPNGIFTFTYTGNEDSTPVTIDEYTSSVNVFTHCKTIATKDNILFAGNIKNLQSDLDYDARAYRFDTSQIAQLTNSQGTPFNYNIGTINTVPETADAINPNQNIYRYQADGVTLGGEGLNIKYKFGTVEIPYDSNRLWENTPVNSAGFKYSQANGPNTTNIPFTLYNDNTTFQTYQLNQVNHGNKLPYETHLFRGYKRNEVYRFGIQFFDKQKNPYYVKWIGDIKMPDYNDTNNNIITQNGTITTGTFRLSGDTSAAATPNYPDDGTSTFQLFIQFDVTIPTNILDKISGYSIVRAERKKDDMTIAGQGMVIHFEPRGGTDWEVPGAIRYPYLSTVNLPNPVIPSASRITYLCPDWMLEPGLYPGYSSGDELRLIGIMETSGLSPSGAYAGALTAPQPYYQVKNYTHNPIVGTTNQYSVSDLQFFPKNGLISSGGATYYNESTDGATRTFNQVQSNGNDCHFISLTSSIPLFPLGVTPPIDGRLKKFVADYYKPNVTQYGGNTYAQRTQTEYILCNHFRGVEDSNTGITDYFRVFGGDTWVNIYDSQKLIKNWGPNNVDPDKYSVTVYFPVETRTNLPLRQGDYISHNLSAEGFEASANETFVYNNVYSNENNILKFFPKPLNVNEVNHWDNRIIYSNIKINGENSDSWTSFLPNNYWDVEGSYGPINALTRLRNEVYSIQDRGFARILINPVAMTNTGDGLPVVLGTGLTIQRHMYLGVDAGSMHQWSVSSSPNSIMFVDAQKARIYMYNGAQLIAITDSNNWTFLNKELIYGIINNDNPILNTGIVSTFDQENSEYLITFLNTNTRPEYTKKTTLVYNEITNKFTSFYTFTPNLYINNNRTYYTVSTKDRNNLYIHNRGNIGEFYGNTPTITLKLIMNSQPSMTKVLDNLVWHTEVINDPVYESDVDNINMFPITWDKIRIYNDYQNTDIITLDPTVLKNIRRVERSWQLQVPRNKVLYSTSASPNIFTDLGNKPYGERMRDKTFTVELQFTNTNNYRFIMHYLKSIFRISYK